MRWPARYPVLSFATARLLAWALAVLAQVMARLRQEYFDRGDGPLFEAVKGSLTGTPEVSSHAQTARRLGMSEGAIKMAVHRLRKQYRKLLRQEIAETVATPELVDEEIRFLMDCL